MGRLDGKACLITGISSGIGAACATRFAAEGAQVAGMDLNPPPHGSPALAAFTVSDVRDEASVADAVTAARDAMGAIDVLVNCAGVSGGGPVHLLPVEEWDRIVDINLKGTFLVCKHVLGVMVERRSGTIVNLASIEGLEANDLLPAYNASKGGVVLLTKQLAIEYGRTGIRVNCICPGFIETPMTDVFRTPGAEVFRDRITEAHMLGRFGRADEVANAALFLASDEASFVTGHALVVDGGLTAGHRWGLGTALGL